MIRILGSNDEKIPYIIYKRNRAFPSSVSALCNLHTRTIRLSAHRLFCCRRTNVECRVQKRRDGACGPLDLRLISVIRPSRGPVFCRRTKTRAKCTGINCCAHTDRCVFTLQPPASVAIAVVGGRSRRTHACAECGNEINGARRGGLETESATRMHDAAARVCDMDLLRFTVLQYGGCRRSQK